MDLGLWLRTAAVSFVIVGCGSGISDESPSPSEQVDRAFVRTVQSPLTTTVNYANVVLGDSPVSYWRLGERSGTTAIDMVGNVSGTYHGAPVLDSPGALVGDRDGAPSFNNPNAPDYVLVPDAPNQAITNAITLECWVTIPGTRFAPATNTSVLVKTTHNLWDGYGFYWNQNNLYFYINNLNIKVGVPIAGTANTWSAETTQSRFHHLVGTYDVTQGKMSIYFDGLPIASAPYAAPINPSHGPFFIGKGYVSLGWYGKIDEVALYNHALSASAVQAHYLAGLGMPAIDSGGATSYTSVWVNQWATGSCPSSCNAVCAGCAKSCAGACSPAPASDALVVTATLLASELSSITGTSITVVPPGQAAPPNSVQLIRSSGYNTTDPVEQRLLSDLNARDRLAFAAISDPSNANAGLKLIGRSDGALNDAAAYYLRLLGERHILPNPRWKFRPSRSSIRWNVARVESPEFAKGINWLTNGDVISTSSFYGDWYSFVADNMLIGSEAVTYQGAPDASGIDFNTRFRLPRNCADWLGDTYVTAPNLCPAGQSYSQQPTSHPEWRAHLDASNTAFAPVTGVFGWHSVGYPQFQSLFAQDRVTSMIAATAKFGNAGWPYGDPDHPQATTVSTEETDGAADDIASPDQVATLANATANLISSTYAGQTRYAGYQAYSGHIGVPSVSLQPNVLVDLVAYGANTSIYDGDELVSAWSQTAAKKRLYNFWADPNFAFETPTLRPGPFAELPQRMRFWRSNGLSALTIEGSKGGGAMGLDWYMAGQMAWNTHNLENVIHTEIMDLAFGAGGSTTEQAMDRMLSRWSAWFNLNTNELTLSISDLTQALGTSDPATRARIMDYVAYVHYLALYYELQPGAPPFSSCQAVQGGGTTGTLDALIQYIWKIDSRDMIHAFPLFSGLLIQSGDANLQAKWAIDVHSQNRTGIGWQTVPPLGAALDDTSLQAMLACDANIYRVTAGSTISSPTTFAGAVTPASGPVQTTWKPSTPNFSEDASFYFYAQPGSTVSTITFDLFPYHTARITFQGPAGSAVIPSQTCSPTGGWIPITFDTKGLNGQLQPGIYTVHVRVSGGATGQANIAVGNGIPFAEVGYMVSAQYGVKADPIANPTFPDTYFYVPPGTTQFGIVADIDSSVEVPLLYDSTGARATDALGQAMPPIKPGWTTVPVNGHYGAWHLSSFVTLGSKALALVNVPNLFSPRPEQVLQQALQ